MTWTDEQDYRESQASHHVEYERWMRDSAPTPEPPVEDLPASDELDGTW